jgi:hypothetical protein
MSAESGASVVAGKVELSYEEMQSLSAWERRILDHIKEHIEVEDSIALEYERAASEAHADFVGYLMRIIAEDEARHHRIFLEWADTIKAMATLRTDGALPHVSPMANPHEMLEEVEKLIVFEREDASELKQLGKDLGDVKDTMMWSLLVDLMRLDTEKHVRILSFIRDAAKAQIKHAK